MSTIRNSYLSDVPAAVEIAKGLIGLFPGMDTEEDAVAFGKTFEGFIARGEALTAERHDFPAAGFLLISKEEREIAFLAVDPAARGRGAGTLLMERALEMLGEGEVSVVTFRADHPEGAPARALYLKFGFEDAEEMEILGKPVQRMVRK